MVVITYPTPIENETSLINKMFEKGLPLLHIRKPDMSYEELVKWVNNIENHYHQNLVIHIPSKVINNTKDSFEQYNTLINNLSSTYIHLSTIDTIDINSYNIELAKLSTSVHSITEVNTLSTIVNRTFLSPIYPSISKKGYTSSRNWKIEMQKRTNNHVSIVALGGIKPDHIRSIREMGFDDYALLGTIWEADQPLKQFELCQYYDQLHWQ